MLASQTKMIKPTHVKALDRYKIWIEFEDGVKGEIDLAALSGKGVFRRWANRDYFEDVRIGSDRSIIWGDGEEIDICADWAYMELTGKTVDEVRHHLAHALILMFARHSNQPHDPNHQKTTLKLDPEIKYEHKIWSCLAGMVAAIIVAFIVFGVITEATERRVTSEYGWTTTESDVGLAFLIGAAAGFVAWLVTTLIVCAIFDSARSPSSENHRDVAHPVRRVPIPRWVKAHLYQDCGGQCAGCLDTFRQIGNMQVDHIIPVHLGGTNELDNLQLLCRSCNVKKGTKTMPQLIERLRQDGIRH